MAPSQSKSTKDISVPNECGTWHPVRVESVSGPNILVPYHIFCMLKKGDSHMTENYKHITHISYLQTVRVHHMQEHS